MLLFGEQCTMNVKIVEFALVRGSRSFWLYGIYTGPYSKANKETKWKFDYTVRVRASIPDRSEQA